MPSSTFATSSHLHSMVYWKSAKNGDVLYLWGQRDRARAYRFVGNKFEETPFMIRPDINDGHPGAMLSLSANGGKGRNPLGGDSCHGRFVERVPSRHSACLRRRRYQSRALEFATEFGHGTTAITTQRWRPPQSRTEKSISPALARKMWGRDSCAFTDCFPMALLRRRPDVRATSKGRFVEVSWRPVPDATTYSGEHARRRRARSCVGIDAPESSPIPQPIQE
jgi:hypothetical protein